MDLGLKGRKAIICASSRGLGRACAMELAAAGCDVVVNGRDEAVTNATAEAIRKETGAKVSVVLGDVSTKAVQEALLAACPEPDILVNNNGGPPPKGFRELDRAAIAEGVVQNMITPIELIQRVVDGMAKRRFGRIINITSSSVKAPIIGLDLSSGARAGLTAFLAAPSREVASANVTINNILPGVFDTDRQKTATKRMAAIKGVSEEEIVTTRMKEVPAGRLGTPDEFGKLCAFICSAHAGYITGQNFLIDGGAIRTAF